MPDLKKEDMKKLPKRDVEKWTLELERECLWGMGMLNFNGYFG
jgi:hypothetical protein